MRELTTVETFNITGRGVAHVVYVGDTPPELHEHILLNGQVCEVTGVEWPIRNGHTAITIRPRLSADVSRVIGDERHG